MSLLLSAYPVFSFNFHSATSSHRKRVQPLSRRALLWPYYLFKADYRVIISHNGLDAYFFVRFLRVFTITLLPIWLISWIILLPATAVNTSVEGLSGLDIFTFGNVEEGKRLRYIAHLLCAYGFTCACFSLFLLFVHLSTMPRSLDLPYHSSRDGSLLANASTTSHEKTQYKLELSSLLASRSATSHMKHSTRCLIRFLAA
jgi:hypothetical protein